MAPPRLALWGTFDVDNYGDHLFPRVAIPELRRRLPGVTVDVYAPYGRLHPTPLDNGPVAPLGAWSPARAAELARAYDTVVIGGGEIIHLNDPLLAPVYGAPAEELARMAPSRFFVEALGSPARERRCPVVWHAVGVSVEAEPGGEEAARLRAALAGRRHVAVRDRYSKERLRRAGVERPIEIVPDSALLLDRVLGAPALAARLDGFRARGMYPPGPALVIQGCDLIVPHAPRLARLLGEWLDQRAADAEALQPVVIETGRCRGDALFAAAVVPGLSSSPGAGAGAPRPVFGLAPGAGVEDLAAAIAGGSLFVGSSLHGAITALVYGCPFVLLNLAGESKLDGFGDLAGLGDRVVHDLDGLGAALDLALARPAPAGLLPGLQHRIDEHFDRIAAIATGAASSRRSPVRRLSRYRRRRPVAS
ncbi:MAG: polysaccharide pyruvyl transferase family protein [Acidimicrobiia bacterium]